jgi:hypothetical protein
MTKIYLNECQNYGHVKQTLILYICSACRVYTQENSVLHIYKINVSKLYVFRIYNNIEYK